MSLARSDARQRPDRRRSSWPVLGVLAVAALAGCTTAQIDSVPESVGGLPKSLPARSETPPPFPAVHDMPPDRAKALLDEEQQKRLEADLVAARNRLQKAAPKSAAKAPPARQEAKDTRDVGGSRDARRKPSGSQGAETTGNWPSPPQAAGTSRNP